MLSLRSGAQVNNNKVAAVNDSGGGVVEEVTNDEGSQQDFTAHQKLLSSSRTSDNGFQNNRGCSESSDIATDDISSANTNSSLRNNNKDVNISVNQSSTNKTIDTKNKNNDGTPTFDSKLSADEQDIDDDDDTSSSYETVSIAGKPVPKHVLENLSYSQLQYLKDVDSSHETVLRAGSPVPKQVLEILSYSQLEYLNEKYTDWVPSGHNQDYDLKSALINILDYHHRIFIGEITPDYGDDDLLNVWDLEYKRRVLSWFQYHNQDAEEAFGTTLLPLIIPKIHKEYKGRHGVMPPSVKANLSIVFSILSESQVFKGEDSSAPSSLEGGGDNVMDVGKCLFVNVVNLLCLLSYPSINISLKSLYPCRCRFYK